MSEEFAIRVENLSKRYRIGAREEAHDTFAGMLTDWLKQPGQNLSRLRSLTRFTENGQDPDDVIWALKDVSFDVKQGEVVGIIGRNGAGKSTLLKVLSRITHPTSGRVELNGRVSSLLEVGTGFHPELTGRENIYLNGTILGMRKEEIDRKFDEIVEFSGVEKFIDTPVKRYSSGMGVRLAFSVAAYLEPEILLIDEVLSVGDSDFQKKSIGKMGEVAGAGRTVIFVSHNLNAVSQLCRHAYWIDSGRIVAHGRATEMVKRYLESGDSVLRKQKAYGNSVSEYKMIRNVFVADSGNTTSVLMTNGPFELCVICTCDFERISEVNLGFAINNEDGTRLFATNMKHHSNMIKDPNGNYLVTATIPRLPVSPGRYYVSVYLGDRYETYEIAENVVEFDVIWNEEIDKVQPPRLNWGSLFTEVEWDIQHN